MIVKYKCTLEIVQQITPDESLETTDEYKQRVDSLIDNTITDLIKDEMCYDNATVTVTRESLEFEEETNETMR